jgi:DNA mismatch repair protein MSH2
VTALLDKLAQVVSSRTDLSTCEENLVHIHPTLTKQNDLEDVLQHVLEESSHLAFRGVVLEEIIQKSLSLLLRGQGIHHTAVAHSFSLEQGVLSSHLVLDRTASEAIHLLPPATAAGTAPSPSSSLYGILNRCRTTMGSRNLKAWLRQPLVDLEEIQQRQEAVTFLLTTVDRIRDEGLQGWPDVDALATRLEGYKEEVTGPTSRALSCLYKLYLLTIQQVPVLCETLQDVLGDEESTGLLKTCQEGFLSVQEELSRSQQLVEAVLDLQEAPRNFFVKASFSDEMFQIKQELDELDAEFDSCLEDMNQAWCQVSGNQNVKLESLGESGDFQFRLSNTNDSKLLQAHFQGITLHKLLKNGVYFSTKELRQLSTKKQDLVEEYDKHQREIVVNAMKVAATYAPVLEKTSALVAQLDCLCSLAHVAAYSPNTYCRPILTDGEEDGLGIEVSLLRGVYCNDVYI